MNRNEILNELEILGDAYDKLNEDRKAKKNAVDFMESIPIEPQEPEQGDLVKKHKLDWEYMPEIPRDQDSFRKNINEPDIFFVFHRMGFIILFTGLIWLPAIIVLFTNNDTTTRVICIVLIILILIGAFVINPLVYYMQLKKCEEEKKADDIESLKKYEEHIKTIEKINSENKKEYEKYKEELDKYTKEYNEYLSKMDIYKEDYSKKYNIAKEKCDRYNNIIEEDCISEFEMTLSNLKIEYPSKYYDNIWDIYNIINECRADSIKEAINVYVDDLHRQRLEEEAREEREHRARIEKEAEADRRRQQLDAEADRSYRIHKIRDNCRYCVHYISCKDIGLLEDVCPRFVKKSSY